MKTINAAHPFRGGSIETTQSVALGLIMHVHKRMTTSMTTVLSYYDFQVSPSQLLSHCAWRHNVTIIVKDSLESCKIA